MNATNTPAIALSTQVLINGVPAKQFGNDALYGLITQQQAAIKELEAVNPKPARLQADIAQRKEGIEALVKYMDAVDAEKAATNLA